MFQKETEDNFQSVTVILLLSYLMQDASAVWAVIFCLEFVGTTTTILGSNFLDFPSSDCPFSFTMELTFVLVEEERLNHDDFRFSSSAFGCFRGFFYKLFLVFLNYSTRMLH